ncbi:hypothetical protein [Actinoplanes siamensis]|uniref:Uncharacterized protein n=1 Tax=Actinoplanes siamensis TaxID=1223317 RepID=A0A919NBX2_9ACTN|nr:hypothetical protein [Actinoplanes siamensis]GIF08088.1 hypothetical protein Asi03nite_56260 [Actinoplanes siamensis]
MVPRAGDVLFIGRKASVQFATPILFRLIRLHEWTTYDGWLWLDGYELNSAGEAVERRSIFVQENGLRKASSAPSRRRGVPPIPGGSPDRPAPPPDRQSRRSNQ